MSRIPERWDRERFERFGGGSGGGGGGGRSYDYEEDYRYTERDRPGRQEVLVADRVESRGPRGTYEERDRFVEEERFSPGRRRRRTDRELFGDVDPREFANLALTPYEPPPPPRPEYVRRRSSFDHFERRAVPRYEVEERRVPIYRPVQVGEEIFRHEVNINDGRGREYYQPTEYREVEIRREKSVAPPPPKSVRSSKAKSVTTKQSSSSSESSVHESFHETSRTEGGGSKGVAESFNETRTRSGGESVHESFHESSHSRGREQSVHESFHESVHGGHESMADSIQETVKEFKKGKTRMPKRLVRREAIMDLGYPFEEEEFFFMLTIALQKEQIDEVIRISETYNNGEKKSSFKLEETTSNEVPQIVAPAGEREVVTRTEWINPPTVVGAGGHRRSRSHAGHRSRRSSRVVKDDFYENRTTIVDESGPPPPPAPAPPGYSSERSRIVIDERIGETLSPTRSHGGALVIRDREHRSDREIRDEIARLEAERRAVRLEREAEDKRDWALRVRERPREELELVEYDRIRGGREVLELYDRDYEERKDVLKVEKDRKGRMALVRSTH